MRAPLIAPPTDPAATRVVPEIPTHVVTALAELDDAYDAAARMPHTSNVEHADRALALARLCARRAAWWRVLALWTYRAGFDRLHGKAALAAGHRQQERARFWRDTAADWRARADLRPTSDAAGALSNWAELGVSA
ncbi:hypothetical protein I4I73_06820 [Pseudonocardia sp. KRD-184]|uniref:Uncharacterized protein n=1 Tax=Pseudonocardia oceani TaxID=2792013 RepID=A0ABS6U7K2_9PSEU|nr:hypothetical protein [Pseudonocardia oceani]MBW0088982.1 hypothetical protein [Pseudonocardia oceani]MBW0095713.1 hypothetical protein [Pseudonocardia oceani]MBW0108542.1 hypothetical protein [Pseudonocardia oceani]MBW0121907.1 hypothetical protein [Pseudonocardia oceani]MBW0128207.1 hypothetical protein [Pseudonocardia oceani]